SAPKQLSPSAFCPTSSSFLTCECVRLLSAHMAPRGRVGVPRSFSKHANVFQRRQANTLQMALLFTCLCTAPIPQHPSFTGIRGAISRSPMATVGLVNGGDNFLMMSPGHGE
ncbi:hypothetical protein L3Q82_014124, partial [Scortum barcoo]